MTVSTGRRRISMAQAEARRTTTLCISKAGSFSSTCPPLTSPLTLKIMKTKFLPASLFPAAILLTFAAAMTHLAVRAADEEKKIVIVATDACKFSVTKIEVSPGQKIHVQLRNEGTLPKE